MSSPYKIKQNNVEKDLDKVFQSTRVVTGSPTTFQQELQGNSRQFTPYEGDTNYYLYQSAIDKLFGHLTGWSVNSTLRNDALNDFGFNNIHYYSNDTAYNVLQYGSFIVPRLWNNPYNISTLSYTGTSGSTYYLRYNGNGSTLVLNSAKTTIKEIPSSYILVELLGAGSGGSSGHSIPSVNKNAPSSALGWQPIMTGSGGSGAYICLHINMKYFKAGEDIKITIGQGGTGGAACTNGAGINNGTSGGDTSLDCDYCTYTAGGSKITTSNIVVSGNTIYTNIAYGQRGQCSATSKIPGAMVSYTSASDVYKKPIYPSGIKCLIASTGFDGKQGQFPLYRVNLVSSITGSGSSQRPNSSQSATHYGAEGELNSSQTSEQSSIKVANFSAGITTSYNPAGDSLDWGHINAGKYGFNTLPGTTGYYEMAGQGGAPTFLGLGGIARDHSSGTVHANIGSGGGSGSSYVTSSSSYTYSTVGVGGSDGGKGAVRFNWLP